MRGIGEKLDNLLDRDTNEHLDSEPEWVECDRCNGVGYKMKNKSTCIRCKKCNGTGRIPKVKFTIEED